jgi:hypothetical protein
MAAGSKRHPFPGVKSLYFPTVQPREAAPVSVLDLEQYRLDHTVSTPTLRCTSDTDVSLSTMSISVQPDDQTHLPMGLMIWSSLSSGARDHGGSRRT